MPFDEAKTYRFNPFDLTKVWPHGDYPLVEVGKLMDDDARDRLVETVASNLAKIGRDQVRDRAMAYWREIDKVTGDRIEPATNGRRRV